MSRRYLSESRQGRRYSLLIAVGGVVLLCPSLYACQSTAAQETSTPNSPSSLGADRPFGEVPNPVLPDAPSVQQTVQVTTPPEPPVLPMASRLVGCPRELRGCSPSSPSALVLNSRDPDPILSPMQKMQLAGKTFIDPFNLAIIGITSGITVAANPHSPYGPGGAGFARNAGVSLTGDLTGEFFGIFAIPSLAHQDPRYHRMPEATVMRRVWHAIGWTVVGQHDDGRRMPNYSTLLTYPIAVELANAYAPGIQRDAAATGKRIVLGYATDPIDNLLAEFLPDMARRIHVRSVFFQQIINKVALNPGFAVATEP